MKGCWRDLVVSLPDVKGCWRVVVAVCARCEGMLEDLRKRLRPDVKGCWRAQPDLEARCEGMLEATCRPAARCEGMLEGIHQGASQM